jgi:Spy/CpxP family protein refolding chaperone
MKSIRNMLTATLLTAGAVLTAAAGLSIASAQTTTGATTTPPEGPSGHHGWGHHRGPWHMLSKLGLSDAQKAQVKTIMTAARPEMQSLHEQMHANMQKLQQTQPTDANYSTIAAQVSETHGSLSAQMMTQQANIRAQIYKVLTPAQQTQLATLQAQMAAHRKGRGAGGPPPDAQ